MVSKKKAAGPVLRLHRLTAKGFGGISGELAIDFDPGVTVLEGENASNKSSVLAALRCVLGIDRVAAGRRAHIGADGVVLKPELEAVLVGDGREIHVRRVGDGSPEVRERVGEDWRVVPRPAEWLRDLIDVQGAVPQGFIEAKDEDRVTMLLEALDLPGYSRGAALEAAGLAKFALPPIPDGLHPLEDLEFVMAAVFNSRTEVHRQRDSEKDAAAKLLENLPAEAPGDPGKELTELTAATQAAADLLARDEEAAERTAREAKNAAAREAQDVRERLTTAFKARSAEIRASHETWAAKLRADAEAAIAEELAETEAKIEAEREYGKKELADASAKQEKKHEASTRLAEATRADLATRAAALAADRERLAALRERQRSADTDRVVRQTAQAAKEKAAAHAKRSEELTEALVALHRYAVELAGSLPIKGLEVHFSDGGKRVVTLDRIPLAEINSGRMQELADEVAMLHSSARGSDRPALAVMLIDWLERVDPKRRQEHLARLAEGGVQVVAAVVGSGPLRVRRGIQQEER